ncbi:MAG: methyltransferase domain-containing protein [Chloroflexi bacterium]|nr:methyltransferase domain-containing protein [Chloroflexota bacterium]
MTEMPMHNDNPFYGYNVAVIQDQYVGRGAVGVVDFLLPHVKPGMSVLDAGCGPGTITQGLAEIAVPGKVIGCDLEPGMVERAAELADGKGLDNLSFQVGNILDLPFEDNTFDVVMSCAVTEHLSDPVKAMSELGRVAKQGGIVGITRTDWSASLFAPPCPAAERFIDLFEHGFTTQGATMFGGKDLPRMLQEAGLKVEELLITFSNAYMPEPGNPMVAGWAQWIENLPLFDRVIEEGLTTRNELDAMCAEMREWAAQPGTLAATGGCRAVARKE